MLSDAVAPAFSALLKGNTTLLELDLSANHFQRSGIMSFVDVLAESPSRVTLHGNDDAVLDNVLAYVRRFDRFIV